MQPPEFELHVDLDGVIFDFVSGFMRASKGKKPHQVREAQMWDIIQATPNFWETLELMPDARTLWDAIKHLPRVSILTCPSIRDYKRAKPGKLAAVAQHLGAVTVQFRHGQTKAELAGPNRILIDDWGKNIRAWVKAGGIGIKHESAQGTIKRLQEIGVLASA